MARILLIDDDGPLRTVLAEALTAAGQEVFQAEDGRQGVEVFRAALPDVVVTDLIMPGKEGIETIAELRKDFPDLPIIAISGGAPNSKLYLDLAQRLGARRVIAKPFYVQELLRAIEEVLTPPP